MCSTMVGVEGAKDETFWLARGVAGIIWSREVIFVPIIGNQLKVINVQRQTAFFHD